MAMLIMSLILSVQGAHGKIEGCSGIANCQTEGMDATGHALLQKKTGEESVALDNEDEETSLEPMTLYAMFNAAEMTCKGFTDNKWVQYTTTIAACLKDYKSEECATKVCELSECCKLGKDTVKEWLEAFEDKNIVVDILQISAGHNSSTGVDIKHIVQGFEKLCKKKNDANEKSKSKMEDAMKACLPKFSRSKKDSKEELSKCREAICEMSECCKAASETYTCLDNIYQTIVEWTKEKQVVIDLDNEHEVETYLKSKESCVTKLFKWK